MWIYIAHCQKISNVLMVYLLQMVAHPNTNWAKCKATMLIQILNHVTTESNYQ